MLEYFESYELYKVFLSFAAGFILGLERELKDKSAGLKTITIICLGSTLFTLMSYKFSGDGDPTRIASYIVSGIGFLGAGVIFKEGFNVYGLTTAGIIWVAAAIGMAIGFGDYATAFLFLFVALFIINTAKFLNKKVFPDLQSKILNYELDIKDEMQRFEILKEISKIATSASEQKIEKRNDHLLVKIELHINEKNNIKLQEFLIHHPFIMNFDL